MFNTPPNAIVSAMIHYANNSGEFLNIRADYEYDDSGKRCLCFIHRQPFIKMVGRILEYPALDAPDNYCALIGNIIQDARPSVFGTYLITYFPNNNVTEEMKSVIEFFNDNSRF